MRGPFDLDGGATRRRPSFIGQLRESVELLRARAQDPWAGLLRDLQGRRGSDNIERISTEGVFDFLNLKAVERTPEAGKRVKLIMMGLGWIWVRGRDVRSTGSAGRVRGYARPVNGRADLRGV